MYAVVEYKNSYSNMCMRILHIYDNIQDAFLVAENYAKKYAKKYNKLNNSFEKVIEYLENNILILPQSGRKYTIKGGNEQLVYTVIILPEVEDLIRLDNSESEESE